MIIGTQASFLHKYILLVLFYFFAYFCFYHLKIYYSITYFYISFELISLFEFFNLFNNLLIICRASRLLTTKEMSYPFINMLFFLFVRRKTSHIYVTYCTIHVCIKYRFVHDYCCDIFICC